MKICVLADAISIHTKKWVEYFAKEHEIDLITFSYTKKEKEYVPEKFYKECNNVRLYKISKNVPFIFISPFKIRKIIKKMDPDIVHAHYVTQYGFCGALSGLHPFVVSAWGGDIARDPEKSKIFRFLVKFALKKADLVHTGDEPGKKRLLELGCDEGKIFIQPFGIDVNRFSPEAKSKSLKEKLGITDKYSVINARHLKPEYDVNTFIKAIPWVLKKIDNVKFIVGGGGFIERELRELVLKLGINDYVLFLRGVEHDEMHRYLASVDIYVDTFVEGTHKGGGGIGATTMEAMSCGTPQILAKSVSVNESSNWFYGLTYEPLNPKDLAKTIVYLLKNEELRIEIGKKSREMAIEIGDWEKNLKIQESFYEKLTKGDAEA